MLIKENVKNKVSLAVNDSSKFVVHTTTYLFFHSFVKRPKGLISIYLLFLGKCVEDATCDVLGTKNECPNGVCYSG